jgi:hypothetical protein
MLRILPASCASLMVLIFASSVSAKECRAVFTSNAAAIENRESIVKKGEVMTYATQYRVDNRTGDKSVCFKGGYCYAASKMTLSCQIDWKSGSQDEYETIYYFK